MQATTCFHDSVTNPIFQEADFVFHNPVPFHTTNGMFNTDPDRRDATISRFLWRGEFTPTRFFLGLEHRDTGQQESLEAFVLIQATAGWQGIASELCQALIRSFAFRGVTQEAHMTGLVDHEEVFERVTLLLAAVIFLWLFGIGRAMDRTFGTIRPNRGVVDPPSGACVSNSAANAAAVRAGSRCWSAQA